MMTPEGRIKTQLKKYLLEHNYYFFFPVQTGFGAATLDCLACKDGKFYAFECKAFGKELTPRQLATARAIRNAGGFPWLVTETKRGEIVWELITEPFQDTGSTDKAPSLFAADERFN
jgi:hypothetical protein